MEEHIYKKIEAYISGRMSEEETKQFELEMASRPELKEEVTLYTSINHHLTDTTFEDESFSDSAHKKEIETYLKSQEATDIKKKLSRVQEDYMATSSKKKPKIRPLYYIVSAAAVLLLLFGLLFPLQSNTNIYKDYYQTSELPSFTSRSDQKSLLSEASTSFKNGDVDKALTDFKKYIVNANSEIDPLVYIYTGLIYSEKGNLKDAIAQLHLLEKSNSLDRSRALWYKALVYIKFDHVSEAKEILNKILENPTNYKYNTAKELLDKL